MITEDRVSCDIAKLLKEKGFNWPVHYVYHYYKNKPFFHRKAKDFNGQEYNNLRYEWYSAPTLQMAMKWLREVHKIHIRIDRSSKYWNYTIRKLKAFGTKDLSYNVDFNTHEQACEAAIKYCLEKLI